MVDKILPKLVAVLNNCSAASRHVTREELATSHKKQLETLGAEYPHPRVPSEVFELLHAAMDAAERAWNLRPLVTVEA